MLHKILSNTYTRWELHVKTNANLFQGRKNNRGKMWHMTEWKLRKHSHAHPKCIKTTAWTSRGERKKSNNYTNFIFATLRASHKKDQSWRMCTLCKRMKPIGINKLNQVWNFEVERVQSTCNQLFSNIHTINTLKFWNLSYIIPLAWMPLVRAFQYVCFWAPILLLYLSPCMVEK